MDSGSRARQALEALRALLAGARTREVATRYLNFCLKRANELAFDGPFVSPARQGDVLLSVLLSTPEPTHPKPFGQAEWDRSVELLNTAFLAYLEFFWPAAEEMATLSDEWRRIREVALPAFLHYFNTGIIANPQQVSDRIKRYLYPFDDVLESIGGLSASDAMAVADAIAETLERNLTALNATLDRLDEARKSVVDQGLNVASARAYAAEHFPGLGEGVAEALDELGTIRRDALISRFGELGTRYWDVFSVGRGACDIVEYPTDPVIAGARPLIRVSDDLAMVPSINSLWTAILVEGERLLSSSPIREKYFARRDATLELEAAAELRRILGPQADIANSVFENAHAQHEHDVVAHTSNAVFIVEAKASPPTEPFRDPERAFTRLRRRFRAEQGIQNGFEQAEEVRVKLAGGQTVRLFDERGTEVAVLDPSVLTKHYSIVVTRDNFGALATDLALLLEKDADAPYPWVVNVLDLRAIADAWEYLGWGSDEFEEYLRWRLVLHGKLFTTDELEIVGFHLKHGSLEALTTSAADRIGLSSHYSDFFDELYRHQVYDAPPPELTRTPPVVMDMRATLQAGEPVIVDPFGTAASRAPPLRGTKRQSVTPKAGRNERCPCGSGKKYKKCCGAVD